MLRRKSNGFTIIEILAAITIAGVLLIITTIFIKKVDDMGDVNMTCVEWEDAQVTDCWSYGMGTTCEHRIEKRCVRYDDGSGKTE